MDELLDYIWKERSNALFKKLYFEKMSRRYKKRNQILTIFQAVVTSTAMGSWLVWDLTLFGFEMKFALGVLLGFAGLVAVVQPMLNYTRVIDACGNALTRWTDLHVEYERIWRYRENLTENDVLKHLSALDRLKADLTRDELDVPENKREAKVCYNIVAAQYKSGS